MIRFLVYALAAAAPLFAQTGPPPRFEVASVKPTPLDQYNGSSGIGAGHGRIFGERVTLKRCIMGAYGVGPSQIAGGPPWIDADRFAIVARADQPVGEHALMLMLQTLLAERFQLRLHHETRSMEALSLEVAKSGPKLQKAAGGGSSTNSKRGRIEAKSTDMAHLAEVLARDLGVPVVDRTELAGAFDFLLEWSPESDQPLKPGETPPADAGPSIYTAMQQQLGLRLQSRRLPVDVLVIDHTEKPSEN